MRSVRLTPSDRRQAPAVNPEVGELSQGYHPSCGNCHRCWKCNGSGVVNDVKYTKDWRGKEVRVEQKKTCPSCRGVGGKVGVGPHNHR